MTQLEQLALGQHMTKQAISTDTVLGVGSMIPGIGAGFSGASAVRNFAHGNWGKGLADVGWAAASLVPGASLLKGTKFLAKAKSVLPWTTKALGGLNRASHSAIGAVPGVKAFQASNPGKWMAQNQGKTALGVMGGQILGGTADAMKGPSVRDRAFDAATGALGTANNVMGGSRGADPRWLTPKSMPSALSPMFS